MSMAYKIGIASGFAVLVAVLCFFIFREPGTTEAGEGDGNGQVALVPDLTNGAGTDNGNTAGTVRQDGALGATNANEDNSALSRLLNQRSAGNENTNNSNSSTANSTTGNGIGSTVDRSFNAGEGNVGRVDNNTGDLNDRAAVAKARMEAELNRNGNNLDNGAGVDSAGVNNGSVTIGAGVDNSNTAGNSVTSGGTNVGGTIDTGNGGVVVGNETDSGNAGVASGANTGATVSGNNTAGSSVSNERTSEVVKPMTHTIRKGETLIQIARVFYGDGERWRDIAKANPRVNPDKLRVGMTLTMPDKRYVQPSRADELRSLRNVVTSEGKAVRVTAKKGDTLSDISHRVYGTARLWKKIYEANKQVLKSPNVVPVGTELVIPPKG